MGKEIIEGRELSKEELKKIKREGLVRALPAVVFLILLLFVGVWMLASNLSDGNYSGRPVLITLVALVGFVICVIVYFMKSARGPRKAN